MAYNIKNIRGNSITLGGLRDDSAIADFQSTTRGLLAPRMTTAQRDAIASPASGLQTGSGW